MNKPWPHYPAICQSMDGTYFITNALYASEQEAKEENKEIFVRLAHEWEAVQLERKTKEKK